MANPILKWAGGKRQIIESIISLFPKDINKHRFHEPMFGGGAVTFNIEPCGGSINDINPRLVRFYRTVREYPDELIERNRKHKLDKDYFYTARKRFNRPIHGYELEPIEEASLLLYLNRTCFNGLYRENKLGEFNVPFGRYKTSDFVQEENIRKCSKILKRMDIYNEDFEYILNVVRKGDFVYIDPPYHPLTDTSSFTSYSKGGFGYDSQIRLRDTILKLNEKGVKFVLSNSSAEAMKKLYSDYFRIISIPARRAINCNGERRGEILELLVTNIPEEESGGIIHGATNG